VTDRPRAPRLAALAVLINERFPKFRAEIEEWSGSFDRKHRGSRLRWPGKRRTCKVLRVYDRATGRRVHEHNPLEAYRANADVLRWMEYDAPRIHAECGNVMPCPQCTAKEGE
jgi:hypothetical protein